jgi:GNAT superfamily N-acetyltransferase
MTLRRGGGEEAAQQSSYSREGRRMEDPLVEGSMIRKLWIGEADQYRDHLLRLDADSRRSRFGGAIDDDVIRLHAGGIGRPDVVLHGFFVDGVLRGAAELRFLGGPDIDAAETAFSIEKPWQSHGVGSALLERCLLTARNRRIRRLHMTCLADNHRMQQLARKFEAELNFDDGSVVGDVETPFPTPLSMFRELIADGSRFANAVLDAQMRLLR